VLFSHTTHDERQDRKDHCAVAGKVCIPPFPLSPTLLTRARIAEGQFYEAQQQTRVVAARYVKQENWGAATDILFNVTQSLLKAGQGGSGGDLGIFLVEVYKQAELKPDSSNKGKLLALLRQFDSEEPTRKKFITEMIMYACLCAKGAFRADS
jgi:Golgi to ER traffic protein 4